MERVGLIAAFEAALRRGAEIDVFADPLLNVGPAAGGLTQMEAVEKVFARIGVRLHKLPKLHSKIVAIDSDVLCSGSYNWLSADRQGQYERHETSFVRQMFSRETMASYLTRLEQRLIEDSHLVDIEDTYLGSGAINDLTSLKQIVDLQRAETLGTA
jgi:hypothetical protein